MQEEQPIVPQDNLPADAPWWARYLVSNRAIIAKEASTWIFACLAAVPLIQEVVPDLHLSEQSNHVVTAILAILGIVAKAINQRPKGN